MEKSSSEEFSIHRSPSVESRDSEVGKASTPGQQFSRGFTAGAFYGNSGSRNREPAGPGLKRDKYTAPKGSKYVVFYLDLSFVFLLEFQKCNMARGCLCCLKYLMFLFNLIFWLCGCGLLGVGIWLSATQGSFATLAPSLPSLSAANLLIAIGTIVMVVGFLGCLGAIKESKCLLLSFFIVLLIIFFMELILVILFFVYRTEVAEYARGDLKLGLTLYGSEGNIGLTNAWNIIQTEYECCGVDNTTDWDSILGGNKVPDSCCQEYSKGCGENNPSKWFVQGCYDTIESLLEKQTAVIGSIVMSIVVIQILGMAFSMTLFHQISRTGKKYKA
ncbi:tetraspanin-9 isoform X1 [Rhincodon typus]|uniref:tetraspanin-9 isoform X1 n=1 Tax=Rhincodon typus TaxID=259920 RepID=UPI00202FDF57|nr:tetraspanin-9 isoform X1 [Rhincodon typus]